MRVAAVDVDLCEELEVEAVLGNSLCFDRRPVAGLLGHELVAGEAEDDEPGVAVFGLQRD